MVNHLLTGMILQAPRLLSFRFAPKRLALFTRLISGEPICRWCSDEFVKIIGSELESKFGLGNLTKLGVFTNIGPNLIRTTPKTKHNDHTMKLFWSSNPPVKKVYIYIYIIYIVFKNEKWHKSKKIATHPQSTPQAMPIANYERNPFIDFIACW